MMESRRGEESAADYEQLRKDWVLGSEEFRQELLAAASERIGPSHFGRSDRRRRCRRQSVYLRRSLKSWSNSTGIQKASRFLDWMIINSHCWKQLGSVACLKGEKCSTKPANATLG